jgi:hypothetical protein
LRTTGSTILSRPEEVVVLMKRGRSVCVIPALLRRLLFLCGASSTRDFGW